MNLFADLSDIVKENEPMAQHTWYKLGGPARYFITPQTQSELLEVVKRCHENNLEIFVLGRGSNLLVADEGVDGAVIHLAQGEFTETSISGNIVKAAAGVDMGHLIGVCAREGLSGLECMVGIPGSVGGTIQLNAGGSFGDIGSVAKAVHLMDRTGFGFTRQKEEIFFGYRTTNIMAKFILGAEFELTPDDPEKIGRAIKEVWMFKKNTQPISSRNAGCVFKNPRAMSSGAMIERAGLMGTRVGGAMVSERHANFILAQDGATSKDVLMLIDKIQETILKKFEVELELEIHIWC
jgi:UDP-N-acetylmuramate dehydrogenase